MLCVEDKVDQTAVSQTVSKLNSSQKVYATRKEFLEKYNHLCTTSKAVLRSMYKTLVGDSSASSCAAEKEIDDRVAQSVLGLDDPEIILDHVHPLRGPVALLLQLSDELLVAGVLPLQLTSLL